MNKIIHTGLYSKNAQYIFKSFFEFYGSETTKSHRMSSRVTVEIAPDNEVIFNCQCAVYSYSRRTIWDNSSLKKILEYVAIKLKTAVKQNGFNWDRKTTTLVNELSSCEYTPSVSEVYFIYDTLMSRKNIDNKYSKDLIERIRGVQADPITAEMEAAKREERVRINEEFETKCAQFRSEMNNKLYEFRRKAEAECNELCAAALKEKNEALAKLDELNMNLVA